MSISYSLCDMVGACVYKFLSPSNSIYKPPLYFDRVGGLYLGFAFSFPNNDCVILYVIWWGLVSMSYALCDMVGACVYKFFFHHLNFIYKPPLCFDRVGGLYFTLFPNTNLPCGGVGVCL